MRIYKVTFQDALDILRYCGALEITQKNDPSQFVKIRQCKNTGNYHYYLVKYDVKYDFENFCDYTVLTQELFDALGFYGYKYRIVSSPKHPNDWSRIVRVEIYLETE